ncbi:MAG: DMT family transporter [Bacteroidales bacterium]|jgi:drug/metabolite transporter (DMT)-like permease|nr:DMT family transporter [Bacteroidales bacterium]
MEKGNIKSNLILLLAAAIWGFAFVAQRKGAEYLGPYAFNALRFSIGALSLIPIYALTRNNKTNEHFEWRKAIKSGIYLGIVLLIASTFQQIGMSYTEASKAGFITSLYVILVPVFGLFICRKITKTLWSGAIIAMLGLYLLSVREGFSVELGDSLLLGSAAFFALHMLMIGTFAPKHNIFLLSIFQFSTTAIISLIAAIYFEEIDWPSIKLAIVPIVYAGLFSVGIAFTLQSYAQKKAHPAHAAIIFSFESVFALIGGWLILNEVIDLRAGIGGLFMLTGIIISQIDFKKFRK